MFEAMSPARAVSSTTASRGTAFCQVSLLTSGHEYLTRRAVIVDLDRSCDGAHDRLEGGGLRLAHPGCGRRAHAAGFSGDAALVRNDQLRVGLPRSGHPPGYLLQ